MNRARVVLHNAVSIDGRTTGFEADVETFYALAGTWDERITLAGSETILSGDPAVADDPGELSWPPPPAGDFPLLAVIDGRARVKNWAPLRTAGAWGRFLAVVPRSAPREHLLLLERQGISVMPLGDERVDIAALVAYLGLRYDGPVVRVESGGALNGELLRLGLVDEISLLIHPVLAPAGKPVFGEGTTLPGSPVLPARLLALEQRGEGLAWARWETRHAP